PNFTHMALSDPEGAPRARIRLTATLDPDNYVDEKIEYITQTDSDGVPQKRSEMSRHDRAMIEVHYLPARRDPADHVSYATSSLLGRMLRAADWTTERDNLKRLSDEITDAMGANNTVSGIGLQLQNMWTGVHSG